MSEEIAVSQKKLIHDLKVNDLRAELEKRSLDKTGVKATLIERLEKALKNEGHDVGTFEFNNSDAPTAAVEGNAPVDVSANPIAAVTPVDSVTSDATTVVSSESEKAPEAARDENGNVKDAEASNATNDSDAVAPRNDDTVENAERDHIIIGSPVSVFPSGDDVAATTTAEKVDDSVATSTEPSTTITATVEDEMDTTTATVAPAVASEQQAASTPVAEVTETAPVPAKALSAEPTTKSVETNDNNSSANSGVIAAVPTTLTATTGGDIAASVKKEQVSPAKKSADELAASVWIRGITNSTKAADLKTLFSKHGKVIAAKIFTTKNKLAPTCFGYITMADVNSANVCIQKLNRTNLKGKVITVEKISKAGRIAASALNTTNAAPSGTTPAPAKPAGTAVAPKSPVTATKPTSSDEKVAEKPANAVSSVSATGGESPEIIFEDVRTKSTVSANGERTDDAAQKGSGEQQPTSGEKAVRPRIVVNKDATGKTASRRIRPPVDASAPKINHTTRTAKNISRRVINTSNARYRGSAAPHAISRASYHSSAGANTTGPVRRFGTRPINGSAQRVFNGPVRPGYRGKPNVGLSQRYSTRFGPPASSSSYGRSSHHSGPPIGRSSLDGGGSAKISSWERNELLMTMRQRENEYRKKEEELKLQRERERLKFERERLEREKLEIQQIKLTAQLASAQMALIPGSAGSGAINYGAVAGAFNKPTKPSSSKKHSESNTVDSRREPRSREPTDRRPGSKTNNRAPSRSRSPHQQRVERGAASFKRGGGASNYTRGRPTTTRYGDSSKGRYDQPHFPSSTKHQSSSSSGFNGRGTSSHRGTAPSRERVRVSGGDESHSSARFSYGNNEPSSGYSRSYLTAGSSGGRNHSPVRRGTVGRSSGTSRDSYSASGVQRFIDDELRGVSQYIARTDPSYASRVTGSSGVGGSSSGMGVSADEMFGLTGSSSGAVANYYGDGYRESLPSTYQATLSTAGSSAVAWNSSGGNRNSYLTEALETSGNWQPGYQSVSTGGRSDWGNDYVPSSSGGGGQHYSSSGRYNSGTASGGSYNSRRY